MVSNSSTSGPRRAWFEVSPMPLEADDADQVLRDAVSQFEELKPLHGHIRITVDGRFQPDLRRARGMFGAMARGKDYGVITRVAEEGGQRILKVAKVAKSRALARGDN